MSAASNTEKEAPVSCSVDVVQIGDDSDGREAASFLRRFYLLILSRSFLQLGFVIGGKLKTLADCGPDEMGGR